MGKNVKNSLLEAAQRLDGVKMDETKPGGIRLETKEGLVVTITQPAVNPLNEALRRYGKTIGLDPSFVDAVVDGKQPKQGDFVTPQVRLVFPHLSDPRVRPEHRFSVGGFFDEATINRVVGETAAEIARNLGRRAAPKPAPKKTIAQVAPGALSTWEFSSQHLGRMHGQKVHLVGQHYRGKKDQEVLGWKRVGNMALLVAEPDNPVDLNAVMVLTWNDQTKQWHHAGYVRAIEASALRGRWTGDYKNVMVARFSDIPANADGHRGGRNIELTLTGECRTYPGYRV
jgi:hypothetical protein